jgi:hypothetical protein
MSQASMMGDTVLTLQDDNSTLFKEFTKLLTAYKG